MRCVALLVAVAVAVSMPAAPAAAEPAPPAAKRLVALLKPHEKEAQAIRFMIKVAPFDLPDGLADCVVAKATPQVEERFAAIFTPEVR